MSLRYPGADDSQGSATTGRSNTAFLCSAHRRAVRLGSRVEVGERGGVDGGDEVS